MLKYLNDIDAMVTGVLLVVGQIKVGLSFGLTSSIITTLGLMIGLNAGTGLKLAVLGGIFTIAIADALSDALAMHVSEESENIHSEKEIWVSTVSTLLSKFAFAITFVIPVLLLDLQTAISVSIIWGFAALGLLSYFIARAQNKTAWKVVGEHLGIALVVVIISNYVGEWIAVTFA